MLESSDPRDIVIGQAYCVYSNILSTYIPSMTYLGAISASATGNMLRSDEEKN